MRKLIRKLSDMRGISGFEYRLTDQIADMFKKYCDDVKIDSLGSVIAVKRSNKPNAPKLMIEAHCDEIGLIVTSITDEGYLTFANVGGVDERTLPSTEVTVHGKEDLWGVIGIKPNYLLEQGKTARLKELAVDTGLSAEKVKELAAVGDSITLAQSVGRLGKKQFSGKSLDDRASVAAIMRVMKNIKDLDIDIDVYAVAAVQEEVGCRGGKTTAYGINPDMAVAIDVCHGITPDNSDNAFEVGTGTVLSIGPNLHPKLTDELFAVSKRHGIKVSTDVDGGNTGTDAWEIQVACDGVPTALISIPLKYMHTSVETLAVSDVKATVNLLTEFIKEIRKELKKNDAESVLVGEVWEDASNKITYNERRNYLVGNQLDSVMGYPFRDNIVDFLTGKIPSWKLNDLFITLKENYPKEAFKSNDYNNLIHYDFCCIYDFYKNYIYKKFYRFKERLRIN